MINCNFTQVEMLILKMSVKLPENSHEIVQLQRKVYGSFFFGEATVTGVAYYKR